MSAALLSDALLPSAANVRHGLCAPAQLATTTFADVPGVFHAGVPQRAPGDGWRSAAGGAGRDAGAARSAAIGEALERYAAYVCALPSRPRDALAGDAEVIGPEAFALFDAAQIAARDFPHRALYATDAPFTNAFSLLDNREVWVPRALVGLSDGAGVATSSGLAAAPSRARALLRALQELVERDALMVTWLHALPGRRVALDGRYAEPVRERGGDVACIDATPAYSPHPVAIVAGDLPLRGVARISLGAACRATWEDAVEKAFLEWAQGVLFAGHFRAAHPGLRYERPEDVTTFDDHAAYYTIHPDRWRRVALLRGERVQRAPADPDAARTAPAELEALVRTLHARGVRTLYRDLTTADLRQIGVYAVRVLSPQLTPIHCHGRFPFLGGRTADVLWRYPWAEGLALRFPNPLPHPLG